MQPFTVAVIDIIKHIPKGHTMTYGQVARLAGHPRAARQVARILHSSSAKYLLPWHRVINAKGEIALNDPDKVERQKSLLEAEGVVIVGKRVVTGNNSTVKDF
ncbi:methylated-DNA--[protein]-cysteine S-methyltransferase [Caldalkalibacillus salinus]|uniref:methylated-DNA--[protein]-cysteine S-methyltransferase n=1 Tax=Caldalkalibacillus salinus TaxID=2803787 RepID=UPI001921BA56